MSKTKLILAVLSPAVAVGLLTFASARPGEAHSGWTPVRVVNTPLPVTGTVNVGNFPAAGGGSVLAPRRASDLVTLRPSGAACGTGPWQRLDTRVNPDGTLSPFVIPAGQVLVVTSADFRQGSTGAGNRHEEFFVFPSEANIGVNFPIVNAFTAGSGDGRAGVSIEVTGVAISAGTPCWGVNNVSLIASADMLLHGFLAPDE